MVPFAEIISPFASGVKEKVPAEAPKSKVAGVQICPTESFKDTKSVAGG